ncbi:MAG: hypothetical protein WCJ97_09995 [Phycisphaerae bacterium]
MNSPPVINQATPASPPETTAPAPEAMERKPPQLAKAPPTGRMFPCGKCGAKLEYDPAQRNLKCPYCGHEEVIAPGQLAGNAELDLEGFLRGAQIDAQAAASGKLQEVKCPGCGASQEVSDLYITTACKFCSTHLVHEPESARKLVFPELVLPFMIPQRDAVTRFNGWVKALWFAPNDLTQFANLGRLRGMYMPFWTYDAMTYSAYTGQRGDDYWVTVSYTVTVNGRTEHRTRQERRTRWTWVSGEVDNFFDDVLVCGSQILPTEMVDKLSPWELRKLVPYKPDYLSGFDSLRYQISLHTGFQRAREIMAAAIRELCKRDIGGDHQVVSTVNTQYVGVTFKHLLLPIWVATYQYHNKTYRILVNAQTGEVVGSRPYSWIKITLAVLAGLVLVAVIIGIFALMAQK